MYYLYSLFSAVPWLGTILGALVFAFQIWMIVDCLRNGHEYYWIFVILFFSVIGALIYFFVCKYGSSGIERGFAKRRQQARQIAELQSKIHHLDKAHHHAELGEIYRKQRKWSQAQQCYEAALEREPCMFDARVHLGYILLAQNRAADAWVYLEPAMQVQPGFETGELLWQAARCRVALNQLAEGRRLYEQLLANHGYLQAQYEYAEVLDRLGDQAGCIKALKQLIEDGKAAPRFLQRTCRPWLRKARILLTAKGGRV